jgi:hypothetical protein
MAKIITAFMKDLIQQLSEEKISFSRMVELINEEVNKVEGNAKPMTAEEWIKENLGYDYLKSSCRKWSIGMIAISAIKGYAEYANTKQVERREELIDFHFYIQKNIDRLYKNKVTDEQIVDEYLAQ